MRHNHVELVAMHDEIGPPERRGVHCAVDELDLAEISAEIFAQELVVIARQHNDTRAARRLVEQILDELVVDRRPVPGARQPPAIDDVADQIDRVGLMVAEEVDQLADTGRTHAEMHVAEEQRPDMAYVSGLRRLASALRRAGAAT